MGIDLRLSSLAGRCNGNKRKGKALAIMTRFAVFMAVLVSCIGCIPPAEDRESESALAWEHHLGNCRKEIGTFFVEEPILATVIHGPMAYPDVYYKVGNGLYICRLGVQGQSIMIIQFIKNEPREFSL
jgi:hypothetical protein